MQRRPLLARTFALSALALGGPRIALALSLSESDAASGIRTALQRGADAAIAGLGRVDGFLGNPKVRIELPEPIQDVAKLMRKLGQGKRVDELVTAMNRAAEAAVPEARTLLVQTVKKLSVEDALRIVKGSERAATEFFAEKTRLPLTERFLPIVTRATERVQVAQKYNRVAGQAAGLGLVKPENANVSQYVTHKALDGLFFMIGEEERKIRADPVGTGSALLRRVFGL